ncbi:MAG: glycosyltransferase family 2 protein, partial [Luteibaculum sp.]
MSYEAAAVILNYNGLNFLQQYLAGVIENTSQHTQVIVVDNNSSDGSVEFLQKNFPDLELISLSENTGYAGGYNAGLQELKHDYFLLLNSDVEVTQHWDLPLLDRLKSNERVAAVQPKICAQFDRSKFEYAGASGGFLDREYFPFCRGRIFAELENDHGQYDKPMEVFWASGACFGIKAKLFRDFEGFDADFFAHMEEIDLCHRLK